MNARPAVFLDRDGTLIAERDYLADPQGVELIPGAVAALRRVEEAGIALVMGWNWAAASAFASAAGLILITRAAIQANREHVARQQRFDEALHRLMHARRILEKLREPTESPEDINRISIG